MYRKYEPYKDLILEKRENGRLSTHTNSLIHFEDKKFSSFLKNISPSGVCVQAEKIKNQKWDNFSIELPFYPRNKLNCEITWAEESENSHINYGLRFVDLKTSEKKDITEKIGLLKAYRGKEYDLYNIFKKNGKSIDQKRFKKLTDAIAFFNKMVKKGGPQPSEYDELQQCLHTFSKLIKEGIIKVDDLPVLWTHFGEPF